MAWCKLIVASDATKSLQPGQEMTTVAELPGLKKQLVLQPLMVEL
jgi:hypothetical protein